VLTTVYIGCPRAKINILGGHTIGHSKQKRLYEHVSYSERFPRYSYLTVQQFGPHKETSRCTQTSNTPCPDTTSKVH
jgi:hypothetical protein